LLAGVSHGLLATTLRLAGDGPGASGEYRRTAQMLEDLQKEANSATLLQRADLAPLYTEAVRYAK
jgi:hypothetical protein